MLRKHTAILAAAAVLTASSAFAEAPTSQFGFTGWPYRVSTTCSQTTTAPEATPLPTTQPTERPTRKPVSGQTGAENGQKPGCVPTSAPSAPTQAPNDSATDCPAATATAAPTAVPTAAPTASPTAKPTTAPTAKPTATPTAKPTAAPTAEATQAPSMDEDYTTDSLTVQEQKAVSLLNADRKSNGLSALTVDPELSRIARLKSEDMRDQGYFAHTSPTYGSASAMLTSFGYSFSAVGENIAHHATVEKSQAAFMSSDGHRKNILGASWTKVGVGVCLDRNGFVYVTQLFVR